MVEHKHPPITIEANTGLNPNHWTDTIPESGRCPMCTEVQTGEFCSNCGQRQLRERIKFWSMVHDLFERLTNIEKGFLFTILSLFRRPGQVARDYVSGKQKCYINPLTLFLLGTAMQLAALWLTQDVLRNRMVQDFTQASMPAQQERLEPLEKKLGKSMPEALAESYFMSIQQGYAYAALLFFCVPFATTLKWFHALMGEPFRLGETTIFSLYIMSQMLIVTAVCTPITARLGTAPQMIMAGAAYTLIPQWGHTDFFQRTWASRLLTFIATGISAVIFVSSILVIFLVTFIVTTIIRIT